jgi:predicted ABC-type ATPase
MRVFAGPNGSGKTSVIKSIRNYKTSNGKLDFGIYVNADDLVNEIKNKTFRFSEYQLKTTQEDFNQIVLESGLINKDFPLKQFIACHDIKGDKIIFKNEKWIEQFAQALADFLRKKLLKEKKKFSFETVFSHESKLKIMQKAKDEGYKVYLYFVSTSSPEINKERVALRVKKGGHGVPPDKIESRYHRSLALLFDASQIAYQAFFFDNSGENKEPVMFANFKVIKGQKYWGHINVEKLPQWFVENYAQKIKHK